MQIDKPDIKGRVEIYHVHLKSLKVCRLQASLCWRMLTYACWRMLTYAHVCGLQASLSWRMLTYADVCWLVTTYFTTYFATYVTTHTLAGILRHLYLQLCNDMDAPALLIIVQQSLQQLQQSCNKGTSAAVRRHRYTCFTAIELFCCFTNCFTNCFTAVRRHRRSGEAHGLSLLRILLRILPRIH